MNAEPERPARKSAGLALPLAILAVSGAIQFCLPGRHALWNLHACFALLVAHRMGSLKGLYAALLAVAVTVSLAVFREPSLVRSAGAGEWLELSIWAVLLGLAAWLLGALTARGRHQARQIEVAHRSLLEMVERFVGGVDHEADTHLRRVADYSVAFARSFELSAGEIEDIRLASWFHEMAEADPIVDVLRKTAALSPDDFRDADAPASADDQAPRSVGEILRHVIPIVTYSQERWDGSGLHGLTAEEIPLGARIVAIADGYDTTLSDRPYHKARSRADALKVIRQDAGQRFDPEILEAFLALHAGGRDQVERDERPVKRPRIDQKQQRAA